MLLLFRTQPRPLPLPGCGCYGHALRHANRVTEASKARSMGSKHTCTMRFSHGTNTHVHNTQHNHCRKTCGVNSHKVIGCSQLSGIRTHTLDHNSSTSHTKLVAATVPSAHASTNVQAVRHWGHAQYSTHRQHCRKAKNTFTIASKLAQKWFKHRTHANRASASEQSHTSVASVVHTHETPQFALQTASRGR